MHEIKVRARKGKEAPDEKMTKCYKLPMSNQKVHRYLNTISYAWYIVSMLCLSCNISKPQGMMRMSPSQMVHACI